MIYTVPGYPWLSKNESTGEVRESREESQRIAQESKELNKEASKQ